VAGEPFRIGLLLFPDLTQLDLTGPYEVFAAMPGAEIRLLWKTLQPVRAGGGLQILPDTRLADCPRLDLICVPGGAGVNPLLEDPEILDFLRRAAAEARWVTSVCTGALLLGAAGLLRGRRATTHWMSHDMLRAFGAEPVAERVVIDGNIITGGGVTAGIDFALRVVAEIAGQATAETIQLGIEYDPHPPFSAGNPASADPAVVERARREAAGRQSDRAERVVQAAAALRGQVPGQDPTRRRSERN
jgi:cyclohexyl-isocyanide hydratase